MIIGIVAISKNFAIGRAGRLPWHYPADLKFFKETTTGHAIVMGATTWRSIGKPLPNRLNVVLSRSGNIETPVDVMRLSSKKDVLELAERSEGDVFIIGGAKTFEDFADVIEKWFVTEVPVTIEDADTFMPKDFLDDFELVDSRNLADGLRIKILRRK